VNTRKFPRTSVEAFGCRGDAACAIERPSRGHRAANWAMVAAFLYLVALLIWEQMA